MGSLNEKQIHQLKFEETTTGEPILKPLMSLFEKQLSLRMFKMRFFNHERNFEELSHIAHSIKASASNLGLQKTEELCLKLETESKNQQIEDFHQLITEIEVSANEEVNQLRKIVH